MSNIEWLNIPDDDISPFKPDIKWFFWMISIWSWFIIFCFIFFYWFSYFIIGNLSLENEKKYFWDLFLKWDYQILDTSFLDAKIELPKNIDVFIVEDSEINAFATLWGNILFTTSLIKELKYEEEFLFILWHEIAHIKNRDILRWISTQIPIYMTLMFLWYDAGLNYDTLFQLSSSYISRKTELNADIWWIEFVKNMEKNTDCILHFFQNKENIFEKYLFFSSTHPTSEERIKQISGYSSWNNKDFSQCTQLIFEKK